MDDRIRRLEQLVIGFPEDLPVVRAREEIVAALARSQVVVVSGDTGSGKTTQLPKICLAAGRGRAGMVTVTQPRRIAARSVAARIAEELGTTVGDVVGFKVRFDERHSSRCAVRLVTDGVLLAEIERDPLLARSDTIIVDEAHERSLNVDFLLGYLRRILPRRPDLKVIVSSATIDVERFAAHFGGAPVVAVGGRMHPIETRWRPPPDGGEEAPVPELVARAVVECLGSGPGDVLAFLGGERDIHDAAEILRGAPAAAGCEVLPLYSRLTAAEQDRVFRPGPARRIVLATNVAETSITVPGIRFVVDSGVARVARWSGRSRTLRLPVEPVSRASADQRRGRCGRVGPGTCVRLYSEADYGAREPFTPPEVLRTNLASVILQMKALRLGDIGRFPFLDPPGARHVAEGEATLHELGAIDASGRLTETGRRMARLPVDPRLARILLAAVDEGAGAEGAVLAAGLSIQDPRERPSHAAAQADAAHAEFRHPEGDFMSLVSLWRRWRSESAVAGSSALRRWCRQRHLSHQRMREWTELHDQLRSVAADRLRLRLPALGEASDPVRVHRAVVAGFVSQVGFRTEEGDYRTPGGARFSMFPGSSLAGRSPNWVVAAEVFETSRRFGRTLARVRGDWIESVAPHLVERIRSEPHWVRATGQVAAWERVQFGQLTVVARRRIPWGPVDPEGARDIFLQSALVDGDCDLDAPFVQANRLLRERIEDLEARRRGGGLLADGEARFAFFDERVPAHVHSLPSFERWRRHAERADPRVLFMGESDLLASRPDADLVARFPDRASLGPGAVAELRYSHSPGTADDGVRARVSLGDFPGIEPDRLDWLVPGLLAEKVEALARSLPKRLRVRLFPLREVAESVAGSLEFGKGSLLDSVAERFSSIAGSRVTAGDFDLRALPPHLRLHLEVVDDRGTVVARGESLEELRRAVTPLVLARREALAARAFGDRWRRDGLRGFDLDELPERVEELVDGVPVVGWPALVDGHGSVSLRVLADRDLAARETALGLRRLFAIAASGAIRHHLEYAPGFAGLALDWAASTATDGERLRSQAALLVAGRAFVDGRPFPRTPAAFERRLDEGSASLPAVAGEAVRLLASLHRRSLEVAEALDGPVPPSWERSVGDIRRRRARLADPAALDRAGWDEAASLVRYLSALAVRAGRLASGGLRRDLESMEAIGPWDDEVVRAEAALAAAGRDPSELDAFRALLEEYRVSLFAQEVRASVRVSAERLERAWRSRRPGA